MMEHSVSEETVLSSADADALLEILTNKQIALSGAMTVAAVAEAAGTDPKVAAAEFRSYQLSQDLAKTQAELQRMNAQIQELAQSSQARNQYKQNNLASILYFAERNRFMLMFLSLVFAGLTIALIAILTHSSEPVSTTAIPVDQIQVQPGKEQSQSPGQFVGQPMVAVPVHKASIRGE